MSKSKEKMEEIAKEVTSLLKENTALISLSKSKGSLDLEINVKTTPFQAAFMASAIGHTNRKIAIGMLTGLLCAILKGHDEQTEDMSCILDSLIPILSEEEIGIMEESALAAFVMRKNVEVGKIERNDIDENMSPGSIANVFGNINTNTVQ